MDNYSNDYRVLGLELGCSLAALKAARRRLVKTWHPDRFGNGSEAKRQAEERIKHINAAFDRLLEHHRRFGRLPAADATTEQSPVVVVTPDAQATPFAESPDRAAMVDDARAVPLWRTVVRWAAALAAIGLAVEAVRTALLETPEPASPKADASPRSTGPASPPPTSPTLPPPDANRYFTVGSSPGEVYAAQGVPTATEPGVWHYGNSKVYFADGVVTAWEHDPAHPLKATALPDGTPPEPQLFTIGSTKAEVRSIQGAPIVETENLWDYGLAKVYFRDDRVIDWESSPMHPLKARK